MSDFENEIRPEPVDSLQTNNPYHAEDASRRGVYFFAGIMMSLGICTVLLSSFAFGYFGKSASSTIISIVIALLFGLILALTFRVCPQWERVTVLKLGKFKRVVGPGFYCVLPFIESSAITVDQRIRTSAFSAEQVLTADLVPVDIDAIIFWMVWDPKKACLEVENYPRAVLWSAQTALRDAIGMINLSDLSMRRKSIDHSLEEIMAKKCADWGITVLSIEIRDITIPKELQDAMSKEAQAEREKNARIILAEVEKNISELFIDAADSYQGHPEAIQLRSMSLIYDMARKGNSFVVVPNNVVNSFDFSQFNAKGTDNNNKSE